MCVCVCWTFKCLKVTFFMVFKITIFYHFSPLSKEIITFFLKRWEMRRLKFEKPLKFYFRKTTLQLYFVVKSSFMTYQEEWSKGNLMGLYSSDCTNFIFGVWESISLPKSPSLRSLLAKIGCFRPIVLFRRVWVLDSIVFVEEIVTEGTLEAF